MPDKLILFYYRGPATSSLSYKKFKAEDYLDYSWNGYLWNVYSSAGCGVEKNQLAPAAIWIIILQVKHLKIWLSKLLPLDMGLTCILI
ncbi:MAG: hypothetical protein H0W62_11565 [Chitinophagales bacterium]|nr:hypothetical protein [Chitinophagales bacterium]